MRSKNSSRKIRLYLIGAFILFAGLVGSTMIYLTATDERSDAIGYEFVGDDVYVVTASDSKLYRHDLERFGGKAAVFADDLNRWFSSLWTGKCLAYLLAVLSIGVALACFRAAHHLSHDRSEDQEG